MKTVWKLGTVVILLAAVVAVIAARRQTQNSPPKGPLVTQAPDAPNAVPLAAVAALPRLVDLGAHNCIPCKMMTPVLEELRRDYGGRLRVDFIDVWQNPDAGHKYGIRLIPTQIFYDAAGKELARHEGFMAKEDILAQWSALGISLGGPSRPQE